MPKNDVKGKKVKETKVATQVDNTLDESGLLYPRLLIEEYSTTSEHGPLTPEVAKVLMGWETEIDYINRRMEQSPGKSPKDFEYGDVYHCVNVKGQKVRCWRNAGNRWFEFGWAESLLYNILNGEWAGPHTVKDGTVNGETIRIGKTGRVLSGQHQLTGLILADERLKSERGQPDYNAAKPKFPFWNGHEHPFIETVVIKGLSEDERILRTIDYVKPRTVADMLYTMEFFRNKSNVERKELTRMLAGAISTVWNRTCAKGYETHPELVGFLERHKRLLRCVEHLYDNNSAVAGRKISKLKLNPGTCAGLMYLMASNCTDEDRQDTYCDVYRNCQPPGEDTKDSKGKKFKLDWTLWDKAASFWTRLAGGSSFELVRRALINLLDSTPYDEDNTGKGGESGEKLAILSYAWDAWKEYQLNDDGSDNGPVFTNEDLAPGGLLHLQYVNRTPDRINDKGVLVRGKELPEGEVALQDGNDFGGIDYVGDKSTAARNAPPDPEVSPEEVEESKEAIRKENLAAFNEKSKANKASRSGKKVHSSEVSEEGSDEAE